MCNTADLASGLYIIDISNPRSPSIVGSVDTPGNALDVYISGNHAYVADFDGGLQIIDITNPRSPSIVGSVDTPDHAIGVSISGNYAYVADRWMGLQIIDITNPRSPFIVGSVDTPDYAWDVSISGNQAYVADGGSGLQIIDITNPRSPFIVGSVDTPHYARDVSISGNHAYVADWGSGLQIIDITNPRSPSIVGSVDTPGWASGVSISGNHAYVADWGSGLQIIDITNPRSPSIVGSVDTPDTARDVFISGNHAYVADWGSGLQIIDITNPRSPSIVGSVDTPDLALDVSISGNHAYVADANSGLQIIDITNPRSPSMVGSVDTPDYAMGVSISGNHAYVADWGSGLQIIDISVLVEMPVDRDPPTVIATNPPVADITAPVSDTITATFDERIQAGTLAVQMVAQERVTPPSIESVSISDRTLVISLTETLAHGTGYGVLIEEGAVKDLAGNLNAAFGWAFITISATAPGEPPVLISPINRAQEVSATPMLSWHPVKGADRYLVQVSQDANFTRLIFSRATTSTSVQVSPALADDTTYFWRVLSAAGFALGPWSEVYSFTTTLQQAFNIGDEVRVVHTGGIGLRLRVAGNLGAEILTVMPEGSKVTILAGPESADGFNWWKVRFGDLEGWSAGRYLALAEGNLPPDPPTSLSQIKLGETIYIPVGGTTAEGRVRLEGLLTDPDGHLVKLQIELRQVGEQTGFLQRATHNSEFVLSGSKSRIDIAGLPAADYHWRARTVDAGGLTSEWVCFGDNIETAADFSVVIRHQPVAIFNYYPRFALVNEAFTFDASASYDPDGDILSFHWDFGDGKTASGRKVIHRYATTGRYTVILTVTDARGFTSQHAVEIGVLSEDIKRRLDEIVDHNKGLLNNIQSNAGKLSRVADAFHGNIDKAEGRIAVEGILGIISVGQGVKPDKVETMLDTAEDEATQEVVAELRNLYHDTVKGELKHGLLSLGIEVWSKHNENRNSAQILGMVQNRIWDYQNELDKLRDEALIVLAGLSPEQQEEYLKALQERSGGNVCVDLTYFTQARMPIVWAEMMEDDRESWTYATGRVLFSVSLGVGAIPLAKFAAGYAVVATAIKVGTKAAATVGKIGDIMAAQDKDVQIYFQSINALADGMIYADKIYKNTAAGLRDIIEAQPVVLPAGEIRDVTPVVRGRIQGWGFVNDFFTYAAYATVTIKNTGTTTPTYYLFGRHSRQVRTVEILGGLVGRVYELPILICTEPIKNLHPNDERVVVLEFYNNEKGGVVPRGLGTIRLRGEDAADGIFLVCTKSINWGTTFIDDETGKIIPTVEAEGLRVLAYPIRSEIHHIPESEKFMLSIILANPYETPLAVGLEQSIPSGIEVISAGDGILNHNSIFWELQLEAREIKVLEIVLQPQGEATRIEMPGARLTMYDRINDNWVAFQSNPAEGEVWQEDQVVPFPDPTAIFDTGAPNNPYPSIAGTHTGTITLNQTISVTKLYTYALPGTGGHTRSVRIWNETLNVSAEWRGYTGDWRNITFPRPFTLEAGERYNYEIITGSYPQIHHTSALQTGTGWMNCTGFVDVNGNLHQGWIPAIKLWA